MWYVFVRLCFLFFFFKQKTAYEMRISDWSSDVCSSDLPSIRGSARPVDMAQVALRIQAIAHALLENLRIGEPRVDSAVPQQAVVVMDTEYSPRTRHQGHRREVGAEGRQQFLRHPGGSQQPLAQIGRAPCRARVCQYG